MGSGGNDSSGNYRSTANVVIPLSVQKCNVRSLDYTHVSSKDHLYVYVIQWEDKKEKWEVD